jgi:sugar-specific transcriptional regulator TrmB
MTVNPNKQKIIDTLCEFGLSKKEVLVYLAILELGTARVNQVSKRAGTNRSSTYVVINSLRARGLIHLAPDKNVQKFVAASPDAILESATLESEKAVTSQKKIAGIIPELRAIHSKTAHSPKVLVFEGEDAIKQSYYSTFDSSEFRIYKDLGGMTDVVPDDYIKKDAEKRRRDGTKMYLIAPDTAENANIVSEYKKHKSPDEFLLVPRAKFSKTGAGVKNGKSDKNIGIGIFKDRIKFASGQDKFAIFIINQEITDTLRDLFDLAWEGSKKLVEGSKTKAKI